MLYDLMVFPFVIIILIRPFLFLLPIILILLISLYLKGKRSKGLIISIFFFLTLNISVLLAPYLVTHWDDPYYKGNSSVKANMHTFQTAVETYAIDWNGCYPNEFSHLKKEAVEKGYWRELRNPYTKKPTFVLNLKEDIIKVNINESLPGTIFYEVDKENENTNCINSYKIYGTVKNFRHETIEFFQYVWYNLVLGTEKKDNILLMEKDKIFFLTNQ